MTTEDTSHRRTRLPSDLKWLLNQRAYILGCIEKEIAPAAELRKQQALYKQRIAKLQRRIDDLQQQVDAIEASCLGYREKLAALDLVITAQHPGVEPGLLGAIRGWKDKYGTRGNLKDFLFNTIQQAHPRGCDTSELASRANEYFGLGYEGAAFKRFADNSVRRALSDLRAEGAIRSERRGPTSPSVWFLQVEEGTAEYMALIAKQEGA